MSYLTAVLIFIICTAVAVLICAPMFFIGRKLRRRRAGPDQMQPSRRMSVAQAIPGLVMVMVMFMAFAHQYIAPESWLGSRLTTGEGRFWFSVLLFLIMAVISYAWRSFGRQMAKRRQADRISVKESDNGSEE